MNVAVERKNRSPLAEPLPESEPLGLIKKTEFLLEVGTEEIPATMVSGALEALKQRFIDAMRNARLDYGPVRMFSTPRRFILHCAAVPERQDDIVEQVMGPSRKVAFDAQNKPTRALQGFLQKNQITADSVEIVSTPKGEYVACRRYVAGLPAMSVLSDLLPPLILSIPFPKSMYWRMPEERFVRPIHYVVALLGREVVPFVVAGVKSGRSTAGHPIMAPLVFPVHSFVELKNKLADHFVLIDADERREIIQAGLHSEVPSGLMVVQDAALLEEVIHLIEYPQVMLGNFEREFLQLPEEVLTTVLRKHQKYFAVSDAQGKIQPHFLTVLNTASTDREKIRVGHQRVLRARLQDAGFYRDFDRRRKLEERVALLEHVVFQKKLGSYADKIRRLDKLAQRLASLVSFDAEADLKAAARLCKTDLTTEMVKEFTELQGIVGGLYARDEGYPEAVWKGIYEHYMPVSSDGPIPKTAAGRLLSIADKVDTLCGFFGLGIIPTGSSDPFSLRRQCQAIVRIAVEANISFSLRELFRHSFGLLADRLDNGKYEEVEKHLFEFMDARVRHLFSEEGLQYDVINSVVEAGYDDLVDLHTRARAIQGIRKEPDFEAIATSFKRINNILAGNVPDDGNVSSEIFVEEAEKELYRELKTREPQIASAMDARNYYDALKGMAQMRPRLDTFFDKVLVMADDPKLRNNRLRLLRRISGLFSKVGDLSQIVVE